MLEENKTVKLKDEQLKKVSGGSGDNSNQNAINQILDLLNSIKNDPTSPIGLSRIDEIIYNVENKNYGYALQLVKSLIDSYGLGGYYHKSLSILTDIIDIFCFELNVK